MNLTLLRGLGSLDLVDLGSQLLQLELLGGIQSDEIRLTGGLGRLRGLGGLRTVASVVRHDYTFPICHHQKIIFRVFAWGR